MNTKNADDIGSGLIALLDLPKHSRVGLDGQNIILQSDDFVGIKGIVSGDFHLVTAAAAAASNKHHSNNHLSMAVGFVVFGGNATLIRRYDPQTEEVSAESADEITTQNLVRQVQQGKLPPTRLLKYEQVVTQPKDWKQQTQFIVESNILQLRSLSSGDKIVPGAANADEDYDGVDSLISAPQQNTIVDGKSINYPPIPVIDPSLSLNQHKHAGTQRFLAKLPPSQRTQLFLQQSQQDLLPHTILQHLLEHYYDNSHAALLGDLQLSFLLFLHLQCLHSLRHWKDLVAMLSLASASSVGCDECKELYRGLLEILPYQLSSMDTGFLEDDDEAQGNFLLPSLQRLQQNLVGMDSSTMDKFENVLRAKFPQTFTESSALRIQLLPDGGEGDGDDAMEEDNGYDDEMARSWCPPKKSTPPWRDHRRHHNSTTMLLSHSIFNRGIHC